jgi:hypothetical protein
MLPPHDLDPFVPPDWRHRRAAHLVAAGEAADHPRDDDWSRRAWRFQLALHGCKDEADRAALAREAPAAYEAYAYVRTAGPLQLAEVEARLLARQSDVEIASRLGLSAAAVAAYEAIFYCVRHKLTSQHYVINVCIGEKVHRGLTEGDRGLLLKLLGFLRGPVVLDQLLDYFANPPHLPDDLGRLTPESFDALAVKLRLQALIVSLTMPGDARCLRTAAMILDLLEQLGVAERLRGESPPAFQVAADAVVRCWKELERVQAENRSTPVCSGAA